MAKTAKTSKGFKTAGKSKKPRLRNLDAHYMGEEPHFTELPTLTQLVKAFSWYTRVFKIKDAREFVFQWMANNTYTEQQIEIARKHKSWILMTDCAIAKLLNNNSVLPEKVVLHLSDRVRAILRNTRETLDEDEFDDEGNLKDLKEVESSKPAKVRRSPSENARLAAERMNVELVQHIEATVDCMARKTPPTFATAFDLFGKLNPSRLSLVFIRDWVEGQMDWVNDAFKNPDDYLFTKAQLKAYMLLYKDIYDEATKHLETKKERKPRKARGKNVAKAVAKVRFLAESKLAKVKSVPVEGIMGAREVWVFNETFRKLGVYHAATDKGLELSRSSIRGFDENRSIEKRVRKPAEACAQVVTAMKQGLKHILPAVKSQENTMSGRLTPNTVIVRVVK